MNIELFKFISDLSKSDPKNLTQKLGKLMEESGELAKVILPYDNVDGTRHKFVEKEKILEEAIDTILCALSIPYALGYTNDDIEELMWKKATKWQNIQNKEQKVTYPLVYEIHITINCPHNKVELFKETCKSLGVKPIILDVQLVQAITSHDFMTSSKHYGDNRSAYEECKRIADGLIQAGFVHLRSKVETVPWHPAAPINATDLMPSCCYFECHIPCKIALTDVTKISEFATSYKLHMSKNVGKKFDDGSYVQMLTYRAYTGTYDNFIAHIEYIKYNLNMWTISYDKIITEFAIYDTKIAHDDAWIKEQIKSS